MKKITAIILFLFLLFSALPYAFSQVHSIRFDEPNSSFTVIGFYMKGYKEIPLQYGIPLFSVLIDSNFYNSYCASATFKKGDISFLLADSIQGELKFDKKFQPGLKYTVRFKNLGKGKHKIENLVPLGEGTDKVYITAQGTKEWPQYLCRSVLYRPGFGPVGVILPDNAWHIGFSDFKVNDTISLTGLSRRVQRDKERSDIDRWSVTLASGGWIEYELYLDTHRGDWHDGLKMMFQDRWLYDIPAFDNSLFLREDLQWMRNSYIMLLQFAWDKKFYDAKQKKYNFYSSLTEYDSLTGGFDIFTLWPTWPRLGLDQRNQWDMYRDLPGGLNELKKQVEFVHKKGKKYFISYNPWDEATRKEDQLRGMEELLRATDADGVVLDTRGSSSKELQAAADKVKPGIIMYSEGMAVPKDMPGIVSGRVHDALVLPPPLNLNKFIKPDFAIFRVLQLADDRLHRELAISFFNGYGVEINTMRPGRPGWIKEEYAYLGRTSKILRENNTVFHNYSWMPLFPALTDSIYINRWTSEEKILYTILSLKPEGFNGALFEVPEVPRNMHYADLWNHVEIEPVVKEGKTLIPVDIERFDRSFLNTRKEGQVGCIALLPELLAVTLLPDTLKFSGKTGDNIVITGGDPFYGTKSFTFSARGNSIPLSSYFDLNTEKIVIQLFGNTGLLDERVFPLNNSSPRLISRKIKTLPGNITTPDMILIPAGSFRFYTKRDPSALEPFIPLPDNSDTNVVQVKSFYMDKYPVTNHQFRIFLKKTLYHPDDTTNFLKHWTNGYMPEGEENYPVVYISLEDARAYAKWANKRLPTEIEWQYAAQGNDMRKYPWGNEMDSTKCNYHLNHPTAVNSFPTGASPFGVEDMIGNIWQMTDDVYDVGCYYYNIIRGGSYYHPRSSIWYVTGGPLPADHPEMLLQISPGLDRNSTVGFRCVKDSKE